MSDFVTVYKAIRDSERHPKVNYKAMEKMRYD